jgi:hypothetical protein
MDATVNTTKLINKNTDSKGRVTLGARLASRTVIIQEISDTELLVQLARVIPENALGLYVRGPVHGQRASGGRENGYSSSSDSPASQSVEADSRRRKQKWTGKRAC